MRYFDAPQLEPQRKPLVPNKIISGMLPGATQIRIGGDESVLIDGKNKRMTVTTGSGSVGIGTIPGTVAETGFFSTDENGTVIFKVALGTLFMFDSATSDNTLQMGKLSNGTTNLIIVQPGTNVEDVI